MKLLQNAARAIVPSAALVVVLAAAMVGCSGKSSSTTETAQTSAASPSAKTAAAVASPSGLPSGSWTVPVDVANATASPGPTQTDWANFAWQTFVALNWPAAAPSPAPSGSPPSGVSGLPDTQLAIGASAANGALVPTVWRTYRSDGDTMLQGAQNPGAWGSPPNPLPCGMPASPYPVAPGFNPMILNLSSKLGNVEEAFIDAPLIEQTGWYVTYDIRLDMSEYTYIQQNGYYNGATQVAAFQPNANPTFVPFPKNGTESMQLPPAAQFGALEIKAAWRVLDPVKDQAVIPRYYTQTGYFIQPDGSCTAPTLFGLIGLHVLRLTPTTGSTWFWATFEHVDNVVPPPGSPQPEPATLAAANTPNGKCTSAYNTPAPAPSGNIPWNGGNTPVNVCMVTPIGADVQNINQSWQSKLAGTVWANYQMIDTINPSVAGGPAYKIPVTTATVNTDILANTSMETYFQGQSFGKSCMDCHAKFGFPQGAPQTPTYQVFTFVLGDAATPPPAGTQVALKAVPAKREHRLPPALVEAIHNTLLHHK